MKILLATDGSRHSLNAARALALWLTGRSASVDVLAVIPKEHRSESATLGAHHRIRPGAPRALSGKESAHLGQVASTPSSAEWDGAAGRWVEDAARVIASAGFRTKTMTRVGSPAVVVTSRSARYDLVVVGAKGRGETPFFDVGSVALAVLEHAPAPVLLVRSPGRGRRPAPTALEPLDVVVAADGTAESLTAVDAAAALLSPVHTHVRALAVADRAAGGPLDRKGAQAAARRAAERLRAHGLAVDPVVVDGRAAEQIAAAARECDLVVMGSRGVERLLERHMGSVSLEVARATPTSVLIVRHEAPLAQIRHPAAEAPAPTARAKGTAPSFDVSYRGLKAAPRAEERLRRMEEGLRKLAPDLIRCRVTLGRSAARHRTGNLFDVRVDLTLPGREIAVTRTTPAHRENETLLTAIDETYTKARRALAESRRKARGARRPRGSARA